jgi:hypothetical protein
LHEQAVNTNFKMLYRAIICMSIYVS